MWFAGVIDEIVDSACFYFLASLREPSSKTGILWPSSVVVVVLVAVFEVAVVVVAVGVVCCCCCCLRF